MRRHCLLIGAAIALTATPALAEDAVSKAKAVVAEYSELPKFIAPGPAFDAKACMAGKKVAIVPLASAVPFLQDIMGGMKDAADKVGFELPIWENQGQPTQWAAGITNAINIKADMIDLTAGVDPATVQPQVEQATAAGIKVGAGHFYDYSQSPNEALTTHVPNDFAKVGTILASWAIAKTEGKANVLVIGSDEVVPTAPLVAAIREAIEGCENCSMTYQNVPVTDWSTKIQSVVQSTLLADSAVNYVLPIYDGMAQFVEPAITLTGKGDSVKIATFNGTPFVIDMVRDGTVEMVIGESPDWLGRVIIDHDMRTLCGAEANGNPNIPLMIWSAANAETAGVPASSANGYGSDYIAEFYKLWGVE